MAPHHALWMTYVGEGHVRPQTHLALNVLSTQPSGVITILCHASLEKFIRGEIDTHFPLSHPNRLYAPPKAEVEGSVRDRIQVIGFLPPGCDVQETLKTVHNGILEVMDGWERVVPRFLEDLLPGKATVVDKENKFPIPVSVVVNDLFNYPFPSIIHDLANTAGRKIPLLTYFPVTAGFISRHYASDPPSEPPKAPTPTQAPPDPRAIPDEKLSQMFLERAAASTERQMEGKTYYGYEFIPMASVCPFPPNMIRSGVYIRANVVSDKMQAMMLPWEEEFEPIEAARVHKNLKHEFLMLGPQYPECYWRRETPRTTYTGEDQRVMDFLESMRGKHGDRTVAYFSLGSTWFPNGRPEVINYVLDSLTTAGIPWVYTYASSIWKEIPAEFQAMLERAGGNALITPHAPQWDLVLHPATRFIISHCGSNSAAEAILAGIPVVAMPFGADQADIAHMLQREGCGIPLHQVKSFHHPEENNKLYDGTVIVGTPEAIKEEAANVWSRMKDEAEYEGMKKGMDRLRAVLEKSRESGKSRKGMEWLGKYLA